MDAFLKLLGFGKNEDYTEKIPDNLKEEDFSLLEVSHLNQHY